VAGADNLTRKGMGRPKGAVNKASLEIKQLARTLIEDPVGWNRMVTDYRRGKLNAAVVTRLMEYGYGKPKDTVALENPDGSALSLIQRVVVDVHGGDSQD